MYIIPKPFSGTIKWNITIKHCFVSMHKKLKIINLLTMDNFC